MQIGRLEMLSLASRVFFFPLSYFNFLRTAESRHELRSWNPYDPRRFEVARESFNVLVRNTCFATDHLSLPVYTTATTTTSPLRLAVPLWVASVFITLLLLLLLRHFVVISSFDPISFLFFLLSIAFHVPVWTSRADLNSRRHRSC